MILNPRGRFLLALSFLVCACSSPERFSTGSDTTATVEPSGFFPVGQPLVVDSSTEIPTGDFYRPGLGDGGVIVFEGLRDLELDLTGLTLRGTPDGSEPDQGTGVGIAIRNCEGISLRGAHLSGYRVAVRIEDSDDIVIDSFVIDPAFGKRLLGSTNLPNAEDRLQIQMDASERWEQEYGAAIFVEDSSRVEVRACRARGGQNGLLVLRSEGCRFLRNDFSYLSGWGIGLAHCDQNLVAGNRCDSVTRRGSGGRAEPDHGSTGILITGGSSENVIAGNSARRCSAGGREVFGGQASGNGNRWIANDFSESECVSVDLDRSQGTWFVGNKISNSRGAGLRARDTERLAARGNRFESVHGAGITLQLGSRALLWDNQFIDCDSGLEILGAIDGEVIGDLEHWIGENRFRENIQDLVLDHCEGLEFGDNDFESDWARPHLDGLRAIGHDELTPPQVWSWLTDSQGHLPSGRSLNSIFRGKRHPKPELTASVDQWRGPASFRAPRAYATGVGNESEVIVGEFGPWDPLSGKPRPEARRARGLLAGASWEAVWFSWDTESDPRGDMELWRSRRFEPLARRSVDSWSDPWGGSSDVRRLVQGQKFGLIATTEIEVTKAGSYWLSEISDDGLRISVDDEVVLEDWSWHPERQGSCKIDLTAGSHRLKVEYFQIDGAAVLSLEFRETPGS